MKGSYQFGVNLCIQPGIADKVDNPSLGFLRWHVEFVCQHAVEETGGKLGFNFNIKQQRDLPQCCDEKQENTQGLAWRVFSLPAINFLFKFTFKEWWNPMMKVSGASGLGCTHLLNQKQTFAPPKLCKCHQFHWAHFSFFTKKAWFSECQLHIKIFWPRWKHTTIICGRPGSKSLCPKDLGGWGHLGVQILDWIKMQAP